MYNRIRLAFMPLTRTKQVAIIVYCIGISASTSNQIMQNMHYLKNRNSPSDFSEYSIGAAVGLFGGIYFGLFWPITAVSYGVYKCVEKTKYFEKK